MDIAASLTLPDTNWILQVQKLQEGLSGYGADLGKDVHFVRAIESPVPKTILMVKIGPQHTNRFGNLHGACIAAIFQIGTISALYLVARKGHWSKLGVGRSLRVNYLKPVEEGDGCWVTSEVVCIGKRMCLLKSTMTRMSDGAIAATCEHERVDVDFSNSKL